MTSQLFLCHTSLCTQLCAHIHKNICICRELFLRIRKAAAQPIYPVARRLKVAIILIYSGDISFSGLFQHSEPADSLVNPAGIYQHITFLG